MNSRDPPSRILLIIITYLPPSFPLTNDYLHELFSPFGEIKKILIFERGKANKCFVEFIDLKNAIAARSTLLGKSLLYGGGKMQIHFSRLRNLDLEVVDKSRGSDYSSSRQKGAQDDFYCPKPNQTTLKQNRNDTPISYSKTDDPKLLSRQLQFMNDFSEFTKQDDDDKCEELNESPKQGQEEIIRKSMESFLDSDFQEEKKRNQPRPSNLTSQEQQQQKLMQQLLMQQYSGAVNYNVPAPLTDPQLLQQQQQIIQQYYMQLLMKQSAILAEQQVLQPPPAQPRNRNSEIDNLLDDDEEDSSPTKSGGKESVKDDSSVASTKLQSWRNTGQVQPIKTESQSSQKSITDPKETSTYNKYIKNADIYALLTQKPSKTLLVKSLETPSLNGQALYNLFSRFGNVDYIVYQPSKRRAFLTFQNIEQATLSKELLNNQFLAGVQLRILFCNDELSVNPNLDEVITFSKDSYKLNGINNVQRPQRAVEITCNNVQPYIDEAKLDQSLTVSKIDNQRIHVVAAALPQMLEYFSKVSPQQSEQLEFKKA